MRNHSQIEKYFLNYYQKPFLSRDIERVPVIEVPNYVVLGQLAALRFIEWIHQNPEGVVALPTGKTPEYFIKWFQYYKSNWNHEQKDGIPAAAELNIHRFPSCKKLKFVQIDEFFPMAPSHERSFRYYVDTFYIKGFGFNSEKSLLMDTHSLPAIFKQNKLGFKNLSTLFEKKTVDFTLRTRQAETDIEEFQQAVLMYFDQWCQLYEEKIRAIGGLGFFLGGIGPDGHIAFNIRGSNHFSMTRVTTLNYESMASAAIDLGGIETARTKAVLTIGLETITTNPETVAIILAAGASKAKVCADAIQYPHHTNYPASALQKLKYARFFVTSGAAANLTIRSQKSKGNYHIHILNHALQNNLRLNPLLKSWAKSQDITPHLKQILKNPNAIISTEEYLFNKISSGLTLPKGKRIVHTGPHHDDIELAYFPLIHHLVRSHTTANIFCYLTSGFTSVTNAYVYQALHGALKALKSGRLLKTLSINRLSQPEPRDLEIHGYLNAIAAQDKETQLLYSSIRICRNICCSNRNMSQSRLINFFENEINKLTQLSPGAFNPPSIRSIKTWIREWEADTVWAHFGLGPDHVRHLRLKFYSGDIFPEDPQLARDVYPLINILEEVHPDIVTLALDPEGSGPDTHYKCLIALKMAIEQYVKRHKREDLLIWGYRNVWSRFSLSEANMVVPVSMNSFAVLRNMFDTCFRSQRSASFPSHEYDGPFSELAQKVWVEQFKDLTNLLGKPYFYNDPHPMKRRAYGAIYLKVMNYQQFLQETSKLDILAVDKAPLKE